MRLLLARLGLGLLSTIFFFGVAECTWRVLRPVASDASRINFARIERSERRIEVFKQSLEIARHLGGDKLRAFGVAAPSGVDELRDVLARDLAALEQVAFDPEHLDAVRAARDAVARCQTPSGQVRSIVEGLDSQGLPTPERGSAAGAALPETLRDELGQMHQGLEEACGRLRAVALALRPEKRALHAAYRMFFETAERKVFTSISDELAKGLSEPVTPSPRFRTRFTPNSTFYICYEPATRPYLDERGCVRVDLDARGCRERPALCAPKPESQRRIVCIGDSFTFGWGVPVERAWPRQIEGALRAEGHGDLRTVNCGAAGAIFVDEYAMALEHRFAAYEPDVVIVTLCLNDLIVTNAGLAHENRDAAERTVQAGAQWWRRTSRLLGAAADAWQVWLERDYPKRSALLWPVGSDPSAELLRSPPTPETMMLHVGLSQPVDAFWPSGNPQRALRAMKAWCEERGVAFGVVIWPFFQGLGPGEHYPFAAVHEAVRAFCAQTSIPFLDLLPTFRGVRRTPELWVSPADYHGNEIAHDIAVPSLTRFATRLLDS